MKKIVLDTNFLLIPATKRVDIFSEVKRIMDEPFKIYVFKESLDELRKIIKEQKGKHREAAKIALALIKAKKPIILKNKQKDLKRKLISNEIVVDDIILEIADKDFIVATQDKAFKKRLDDKKINYIYLKNKKLVKNVL